MKMFKRNTLAPQTFKCLRLRHSFRGNWENGISKLHLKTAKRYLRAARFHIRAGGSKSAEKYQPISKFAFYYLEVRISLPFLLWLEGGVNMRPRTL